MAKRKPGRNDVVVGIAASGRTPFTLRRRRLCPEQRSENDLRDLQSQYAAAKARTSCHRDRSWSRSDLRIHPHESWHGAENGPEHALQRRHDPPGICLWKPDGERHAEEFEAGARGSKHSAAAAGVRQEKCTAGFAGGGKQRSRRAGHAASRGGPHGGRARLEIGRRTCARGDRSGPEFVRCS